MKRITTNSQRTAAYCVKSDAAIMLSHICILTFCVHVWLFAIGASASAVFNGANDRGGSSYGYMQHHLQKYRKHNVWQMLLDKSDGEQQNETEGNAKPSFHSVESHDPLPLEKACHHVNLNPLDLWLSTSATAPKKPAGSPDPLASRLSADDVMSSFTMTGDELSLCNASYDNAYDERMMQEEETCMCTSTENVAIGLTATQSSTEGIYAAGLAVDNNFFSTLDAESCSSTMAEGETAPWWKVDLGGSYPISLVRLHNLSGECPEGACSDRLHDITVSVLDANGVVLDARRKSEAVGSSGIADFYFMLEGNFIMIQLDGDSEILSLCEVQVFISGACINEHCM